MKLTKKISKTNKAVQKFIQTIIKNYKSMKEKIKKIWLMALVGITLGTMLIGCNVTRVMTNESKFFQKGDTAVTIQTKTIETYNAEKTK